MSIKTFDTVVLVSDIPEKSLLTGDMGVVVESFAPDTFEVEFVTASGKTQALVTLTSSQIRLVGPNDLLSVRHLDAA